MTEEEFDEERELCPDGGCVGVLGSDGRCKVCGLGSKGKPPEPASDTFGFELSAFGDDDRQLCPDGACLGVVGADGKCKLCGRSAAS